MAHHTPLMTRASLVKRFSALPANRRESDSFANEPTRLFNFDSLENSGTHPLEPMVQKRMESHFDHSFDRVRVHADQSAADAAARLGAKAFTLGNHIVFAAGTYDPTSPAGQSLLAHELTHVVQAARHQRADRTNRVAPVDHPAEKEASRVAHALASGESAPAIEAVPEGIHRDVGWARRGRNDPYGFGEQENLDNATMAEYVDAFDHIIYDLNYRSDRGGLSRFLQVRYGDGTTLDISIDSVADSTSSAGEMATYMFHHRGAGNRIYPHEMNRSTTPALWNARQQVWRIMDDYNTLFILSAFPTVWMILTAGAGVTARPASPSRSRVPPSGRQAGGSPGESETVTPPAPETRMPSPPSPQRTPSPPTPQRAPGAPARTSGPGNRSASVRSGTEREPAPSTPLTAQQERIQNVLLGEHPGLNPRVAAEASRGARTVMGPGGAGADVPLLNGGGREVSVHQGAFTSNSVGNHLQAEVAQAGTTEVFLQINSAGATREGLLQIVPGIRNAFPELRNIFVRFFGPDGSTWWNGRFGGPP